MNRQDILACCEHFGLQNIQIGFDQPDHPNGSCFAFVASKKQANPATALSEVTEPKVSESLSPLMQLEYQHQIHQLQQQHRQYQHQIERLQQDLQTARTRIEAMESSKFWKLRKSWFTFKRKFGLPSNE